jgi:peptidoglycan/xylan/chitin deacetylase (PgdA/CDA1 family)
MLLAVGYHYVAENAPDAPRAIFPITTQALAAQIELLASQFELVSRDQLLAAVAGERALPERACALTFDDGLRCQVELALPVLERLGVPAIFFVPGAPLAEDRVLDVHKLHALRERLDEAEFARRLDEVLEQGRVRRPDVSDEQAAIHYRYDTPAAARVKFLLNIALPREARRQAVKALFVDEFPDERTFAGELYADRPQIVQLELEHAAIGAHSYGHEPLASLADDELDLDLARVTQLLRDLTGVAPRAFSYPYGTPATVDARVAARARAAGYRAAFTMERATNGTLDEPLLLARLDTNDVQQQLPAVDGAT